MEVFIGAMPGYIFMELKPHASLMSHMKILQVIPGSWSGFLDEFYDDEEINRTILTTRISERLEDILGSNHTCSSLRYLIFGFQDGKKSEMLFAIQWRKNTLPMVAINWLPTVHNFTHGTKDIEWFDCIEDMGIYNVLPLKTDKLRIAPGFL
ncbi:hypothetical protein TWF694_003103 [Orbilia ellipsospora]|uniref:Uncharacterized protein n=1 Tax=Orbilia ellipsospora TaxID=2528407 RepID=A0AAV9X1H5_9PEZI